MIDCTRYYPEIRAAFSNDLVRWNLESLRSLQIPESSVEFLAGVGLPNLKRWTVTFAPPANGQPLSRAPSAPHLVIIGADYRYPVYMNEHRNGAVFEANASHPSDVRFVNSSAELFGVFILLHQRSIDRSKAVEPRAYQSITDHLEDQMRSLDPNALESPDNFWATFIEEMRLY